MAWYAFDQYAKAHPYAGTLDGCRRFMVAAGVHPASIQAALTRHTYQELKEWAPQRVQTLTEEVHCFETMHYELRHVGGRYGYGDNYTRRGVSRGFSFF